MPTNEVVQDDAFWEEWQANPAAKMPLTSYEGINTRGTDQEEAQLENVVLFTAQFVPREVAGQLSESRLRRAVSKTGEAFGSVVRAKLRYHLAGLAITGALFTAYNMANAEESPQPIVAEIPAAVNPCLELVQYPNEEAAAFMRRLVACQLNEQSPGQDVAEIVTSDPSQPQS